MARKRHLILSVAVAVLGLVGAVLSLARARDADAISLPSDIPADCSRPVDVDINRFIAATPDGSRILFEKSGCYAQDGQLEVNDRSNLTLDGNGATFRAVTERDDGTRRANWAVQGGRNIVLRNMTVFGVYPKGEFDRMLAGDRRPYEPRMDLQQGYLFGAVQGGGLYDSAAYNTFSDPVLISWDVRPEIGTACTTPPRDIEIRRVTGMNTGRTVGIAAGERITIADSVFGDMRDNGIDLETDAACSVMREIRIVDNRLGRHWFSGIAHTGYESGSNTGRIEITGNVQEKDPSTCWPPLYLSPHAANGRRGPYIIRENNLRTLTNGVVLNRANGGNIAMNRVEKMGGRLCSAGPADRYHIVKVEDSVGLNIEGNVGTARPLDSGFAGETTADSLSAGLTQAGELRADGTNSPAAQSSLTRTEAESIPSSGCWAPISYGGLSGAAGLNCVRTGAGLSWTVTVPSGRRGTLRLFGYQDTLARGFRVRLDGGEWIEDVLVGDHAPSTQFFASPDLGPGNHTVELESTASAGSFTFDYYELAT